MKIVFFDGYCIFCNLLVNWIIQIDRTKEIRFATLQGTTASRLLNQTSGSLDIDTVIYLQNNVKYERSTAILKILSDTGGIWRFAWIFSLVPRFIREFVYRLVAKNRYYIFGKREICRIPTDGERARFLA